MKDELETAIADNVVISNIKRYLAITRDKQYNVKTTAKNLEEIRLKQEAFRNESL